MIKEREEFLRTCLYAFELCLISANFFLVYYFVGHAKSFYFLDIFPSVVVIKKSLYSIDLYMRAYWLALVVWAILLRIRGEYHHLRIQTYYRVIGNHLINGFFFLTSFMSFACPFKCDFLSRL